MFFLMCLLCFRSAQHWSPLHWPHHFSPPPLRLLPPKPYPRKTPSTLPLLLSHKTPLSWLKWRPRWTPTTTSATHWPTSTWYSALHLTLYNAITSLPTTISRFYYLMQQKKPSDRTQHNSATRFLQLLIPWHSLIQHHPPRDAASILT